MSEQPHLGQPETSAVGKLRRAIMEHRTAITNAGMVRVDSRDVPVADAKQRADRRLWAVLDEIDAEAREMRERAWRDL